MASGLAGLKAAAPNQKDPFFLVGNYKVAIERTKLHESQDGKLMFIIGAKIIGSDVAARGPGMVCSQVIVITGNKSGLGNVKTFFAAALEYDPADADLMAEIDEAMVQDEIKNQALKGTVFDLSCTNIKTKAGGDFTQHTWRLAKDAA